MAASSGESDNIHAGVYAGTNWGATNFRAGTAYTWNDISTSRNVGIPPPQLLEADYDAGTAQVFGERGYGSSFGAVDFEPFAGHAYVNLNTDGFTEIGGPVALTSGSDSTDATYTTLGLRASPRSRPAPSPPHCVACSAGATPLATSPRPPPTSSRPAARHSRSTASLSPRTR